MKTLSIRIIILSGSHLPYLNYELVNASLEYFEVQYSVKKIHIIAEVVHML